MTRIPTNIFASKETIFHVSNIAGKIYREGKDRKEYMTTREAAQAAADIFAETCVALVEREPEEPTDEGNTSTSAS